MLYVLRKSLMLVFVSSQLGVCFLVCLVFSSIAPERSRESQILLVLASGADFSIVAGLLCACFV